MAGRRSTVDTRPTRNDVTSRSYITTRSDITTSNNNSPLNDVKITRPPPSKYPTNHIENQANSSAPFHP